MVFYLKINRDTKHYLQHWIETLSYYEGATVFIICDNPSLTDSIIQRFKGLKTPVYQRFNYRGVWYEFIESDRTSEDAKYVVDNAVIPYWRNATFAHLTTFIHAKANGFDKFWNIDADDTLMCLSPEKAAKVLKAVEQSADERGIDIFALDMWLTFTLGRHWTFGVVYVNNTVDWFAIMKAHCTDAALVDRYDLVGSGRNLDWLFTYLNSINAAYFGTFYVENLRFMHHHDYVYFASNWGIYYWKNGRRYDPVLCNECGLGEGGSLPIWHDVIKIDIGLTDDDSANFFRTRARPGVIRRYLDVAGNSAVKATLSIIMYVDNAEKWIPSCLWFLDYQNLKDFEIIIVDDGSTDATYRLAETMSEIFCGRMKIIRNETPRGFSKSLNLGLRRACGKYIMFLDCTDLLTGDFVRFFCAHADKQQAEVLQSTRFYTLPPGNAKYLKHMRVVQTLDTRGGGGHGFAEQSLDNQRRTFAA